MACISSSGVNGSIATPMTASSRVDGLLPHGSRLSWPCLRLSEQRAASLLVSRASSAPSRKLFRSFATSLRAEYPTEELDATSEDEGSDSMGSSDMPSFPDITKLYVGNLPWSCDSEELAQVFQKVGGVEMVEVIYDRMTGKSRGFGFVTMSTLADANAAIEKLDGADLAGRSIRVNFPNTAKGESPLPRPRYDLSNTNKLFVGNLAWGVDNARLQELFSEFGQVVEARIVLDRETGRSRGFGFVTMSSEDEVNEAMNKMDGMEVDGRSLRVNLAGQPSSVRGDFV